MKKLNEALDLVMQVALVKKRMLGVPMPLLSEVREYSLVILAWLSDSNHPWRWLGDMKDGIISDCKGNDDDAPPEIKFECALSALRIAGLVICSTDTIRYPGLDEPVVTSIHYALSGTLDSTSEDVYFNN